jgi:transcriptional regulator of acetoin/glycerol metabolism
MHHMQRLAAMRAPRIDLEHLPRELRAASKSVAPPPTDERSEVLGALAETGGNISHAATRLGITRHGLKKRMLRLGMRSKA